MHNVLVSVISRLIGSSDPELVVLVSCASGDRRQVERPFALRKADSEAFSTHQLRHLFLFRAVACTPCIRIEIVIHRSFLGGILKDNAMETGGLSWAVTAAGAATERTLGYELHL